MRVLLVGLVVFSGLGYATVFGASDATQSNRPDQFLLSDDRDNRNLSQEEVRSAAVQPALSANETSINDAATSGDFWLPSSVPPEDIDGHHVLSLREQAVEAIGYPGNDSLQRPMFRCEQPHDAGYHYERDVKESKKHTECEDRPRIPWVRDNEYINATSAILGFSNGVKPIYYRVGGKPYPRIWLADDGDLWTYNDYALNKSALEEDYCTDPEWTYVNGSKVSGSKTCITQYFTGSGIHWQKVNTSFRLIGNAPSSFGSGCPICETPPRTLLREDNLEPGTNTTHWGKEGAKDPKFRKPEMQSKTKFYAEVTNVTTEYTWAPITGWQRDRIYNETNVHNVTAASEKKPVLFTNKSDETEVIIRRIEWENKQEDYFAVETKPFLSNDDGFFLSDLWTITRLGFGWKGFGARSADTTLQLRRPWSRIVFNDDPDEMEYISNNWGVYGRPSYRYWAGDERWNRQPLTKLNRSQVLDRATWDSSPLPQMMMGTRFNHPIFVDNSPPSDSHTPAMPIHMLTFKMNPTWNIGGGLAPDTWKNVYLDSKPVYVTDRVTFARETNTDGRPIDIVKDIHGRTMEYQYAESIGRIPDIELEQTSNDWSENPPIEVTVTDPQTGAPIDTAVYTFGTKKTLHKTGPDGKFTMYRKGISVSVITQRESYYLTQDNQGGVADEQIYYGTGTAHKTYHTSPQLMTLFVELLGRLFIAAPIIGVYLLVSIYKTR